MSLSRPIEKIRELVEAHRAAEDLVLEQPIHWNPAAWKRADLEIIRTEVESVEDLSEELRGGWRQVRRKHVGMLDSDLGLGPRGIFVGAMIWGFGPIGYGASRTARIVAPYSRGSLAKRLQPFADAAAKGPGDAWDVIAAKKTKIRGLGPAFGTKVTYFLARSEDPPPSPLPLIADLNTSWAIWNLCQIPLSAFDRSHYLRYVETAHQWAHELRCPVDEVERALFEYGKKVPRRV